MLSLPAIKMERGKSESTNKLVKSKQIQVKEAIKRARHMSMLVPNANSNANDSGWLFETSGLNLKILQDAHIIAASK